MRNKSFKNPEFPLLVAWGTIVLAYFVFEINMIGKAHDYYLFPLYPLLFMVVSYGAYNLLNLNKKFMMILTVLLLLLLPLTAWLRMQNRWDPDSPRFNKDLLLYKKELQQAVPKSSLVVAGNDISHFVMFYYIDKKGWGFDTDYLDGQMLQSMIDKGAGFLYSDSRKIEEREDVRCLLDSLVLERGSMRIFTLKPCRQQQKTNFAVQP